MFCYFTTVDINKTKYYHINFRPLPTYTWVSLGPWAQAVNGNQLSHQATTLTLKQDNLKIPI